MCKNFSPLPTRGEGRSKILLSEVSNIHPKINFGTEKGSPLNKTLTISPGVKTPEE
jgi:hypothetical protein